MSIFAHPLIGEIVRWCNGSTRDFGSLGLGSNPGRTTEKPVTGLIRAKGEKILRGRLCPLFYYT